VRGSDDHERTRKKREEDGTTKGTKSTKEEKDHERTRKKREEMEPPRARRAPRIQIS
jgi:hypothetical protein